MEPAVFIERVRDHRSSTFYRDIWGNVQSIFELPTVSRTDFVRTPLSRRRYKDGKALIKIVHAPTGPFLSEWEFPDIAQERYGTISKRPMVYLSDPHDALEKALWCYEHAMVPLIGEKNPAVAASAATKYEIDSLICDTVSLQALLPHLEQRNKKLSSISILLTAFSYEEILSFEKYAERIRLVLALPEAGAFAEAEFSEHPRFTPHPGCIIECVDTLILTKLFHFTTPIIRYDTGIEPKGYSIAITHGDTPGSI